MTCGVSTTGKRATRHAILTDGGALLATSRAYRISTMDPIALLATGSKYEY